ncbi:MULTISPECIES: copper homeostasis protein CutC [unclassified Agrobacterium]|uniref:copper homeostasis protein CutC n=1 Tax=unclassified Agrobacterium TaxID=2632611 RepID=UPI00083CDB29|nr:MULTISPECIES: copper homeostasis protein CutC [unclassified Agrobacterium]AOG12146.1 cutC family protein [Agrobacterium sp. RAC06]QGG91810.1 copper homeostasis protein CutC [Agrobacterium sp. MA01]
MVISRQEAPGPLLEICVDDVAGLEAAIVGGADRIELCSALGSGGLTPSRGFMAIAANAPIPVHALIRPRAGHFTYSKDEIAVMEADILAAREAGLAGVVIGATTMDAALDIDAIRRLIRVAEGLDLTLHRAIDVVADMEAALDLAIELGFSRVLTSGGARHAEEGLAVIKRLARHGAGCISIMPGGGVRPENAAIFLAVPEIRELHASCSQADMGQDRLVELGFEDQSVRRTDADTVRRLKVSMVMRS